MSSLGGILDVAIGMSFMYLLLSLFGSSLNELVAWVIGLRAKTLRAGLSTLLSDPNLVGFIDNFYKHPLVKSLSHNTDKNDQAAPSYIPASTFSLALLDTLGQHGIEPVRLKALAEAAVAAVPEPNLRAELVRDCQAVAASQSTATVVTSLRKLAEKLPSGAPKAALVELLYSSQLLREIDGVKRLLASLPASSSLRRQLELFIDDDVAGVAEFRRRIETWFDNAMDRLTGVYRRRAQVISLVVGMILAFGTGVDSLLVADTLMSDGALRQATVTAAVRTVNEPTSGSAAKPDAVQAVGNMAKTMNQLDRLKLPVGWRYFINARNSQVTDRITNQVNGEDNDTYYWLWRVLGMIFTGLALAFGAPFWFDMLSKLVNVRSAGPPPYREPPPAPTGTSVG